VHDGGWHTDGDPEQTPDRQDPGSAQDAPSFSRQPYVGAQFPLALQVPAIWKPGEPQARVGKQAVPTGTKLTAGQSRLIPSHVGSGKATQNGSYPPTLLHAVPCGAGGEGGQALFTPSHVDSPWQPNRNLQTEP